MKVWIDAQLSPALARWLTEHQGVEAFSVRRLGLRDATDEAIFHAARDAEAIVMTKDRDFMQLLARAGPPPQVIWITCGNTSNARMREILEQTFTNALVLLRDGEPFVEIADPV
ncbi:MAG: DUF5615 family PIN-like protein [Gammaproteobacteria bacterium]|nr:DUF5615 family PIN-like protein [Gammaproteobacteria bacterium]